MKNKIKLLMVLTIALIPYYVKADMGSPEIKPYDMVITTPDGKNCTSGDAIINMKKDETFTVRYEYNDNYTIEYNNMNCTLENLDGASLVVDELDPKTAVEETKENTPKYIVKSDKKIKAIVYSDTGVDVKKGPANIYETVGHLDKGRTFEYIYSNSGASNTTHVYIDEENIKGWVEILESKVLIENKDKYLTMTDMKLSCATIPKNTIIVPKYNTDSWSHQSLVEYEGCQKLVENRFGEKEMVILWPRKYHSKSELTIYEYYGNTGNELAKIPADADFISYAQSGIQGDEFSNLYVEYNQIKGWVKSSYTNYELVEDLSMDDLKLEELEDEEEEEIITIGAETETKEEDATDFVVKCVLIGLCIVITAIVVIVLINRKKNKSEE